MAVMAKRRGIQVQVGSAVPYIKKKNAGHPIYSHAHFRTVAETMHFAEEEHFKLRTSCSALFGEPDRFQSEPSRKAPARIRVSFPIQAICIILLA